MGTTPLPAINGKERYSSAKTGVVESKQLRGDRDVGTRIERTGGLQLNGAGKATAMGVNAAGIGGGAEAQTVSRPSTSDGLRSAFGRQSKPVNVNANTGTLRQSTWKRFIKGMSGDDSNSTPKDNLGLPSSFSSTSSSMSGAGEAEGTLKKKKRQGSFVGRMLERTVSNTDAGRKSVFGSAK
jgi:hypothetical protein